jgi:hypothetical protein
VQKTNDNEKIRIRMIQDVNPDFPFLLSQDERKNTYLLKGQDYDAMTNPQGAISAICDTGVHLGVKPNEFEFLEAPEWVLIAHKKFEMIRMQKEIAECEELLAKEKLAYDGLLRALALVSGYYKKIFSGLDDEKAIVIRPDGIKMIKKFIQSMDDFINNLNRLNNLEQTEGGDRNVR